MTSLDNIVSLVPKTTIDETAVEYLKDLVVRLESGETLEILMLVSGKDEYQTQWFGLKEDKFRIIGMMHIAAERLSRGVE